MRDIKGDPVDWKKIDLENIFYLNIFIHMYWYAASENSTEKL